jgi:hypothetical protein
MALKPKSIIETAVELGRNAITRGTELTGRWRNASAHRPSGSPSTVGAPKPGAPRGHKSSTAAGKKT